MATNVGNPVQSCVAKASDYIPEQPQDPRKHFINFKLVDDKGKPVENVRLNVILPDGTPYDGNSNGEGKIEIPNVDPGSCKIEFDDWRTFTLEDSVLIS